MGPWSLNNLFADFRRSSISPAHHHFQTAKDGHAVTQKILDIRVVSDNCRLLGQRVTKVLSNWPCVIELQYFAFITFP